MKKIGILTFHNAHNYGAMLQAYALQKILSSNNYDAKIIDYRDENIENSYKILKINSKNPIKVAKSILDLVYNYSKIVKRYNVFNKFMFNKFNLTRRINNIDELEKYILNLDACITGSDQVWNPLILGKLSDIYTLNFKNTLVKRISYAASIGNKYIENNYKNEYKRKISNINHISVREQNAKKELEKIIDNPIEVVLDPTLLLRKEDWEKEIENCQKEKEKYILAYVVAPDNEYIKIVNYLSEKTRLKVIHFGKKDIYNNIYKNAFTEGPLEFINLVKNAEYIVATSFHATVFSILFNKKFFTVPNIKTGTRITDLLDKLQIKNRVYSNLEEFKNVDYDFVTDYKKVEEILELERKSSIDFLKNSIEH